MDLTFTEPETAFRDELRAWLAENPPGEEPVGEDAEAVSVATRLPAPARRRRLGGGPLAGRVRRPRRRR